MVHFTRACKTLLSENNKTRLTFEKQQEKNNIYVCMNLYHLAYFAAVMVRYSYSFEMPLREFFVDTLQVECLVVELRLGHLLLLECQGVKCRLLLQPLKHLWHALQYSGKANRGAASLSRFFLWDNLRFDVQGLSNTKKVWLSGLTRLSTSPKKSLKSCLLIPPIRAVWLSRPFVGDTAKQIVTFLPR